MKLLGFCGPSYAVSSTQIDSQVAINLYLEGDELGTASNAEPLALIGTPGFSKLLAQPLDMTTNDANPCRWETLYYHQSTDQLWGVISGYNTRTRSSGMFIYRGAPSSDWVTITWKLMSAPVSINISNAIVDTQIPYDSNAMFSVCDNSTQIIFAEYNSGRCYWFDTDPTYYPPYFNNPVQDLVSISTSMTISASAKTITRVAGSFLAEGFVQGMNIIASGFVGYGNNIDWYGAYIASISGDGKVITIGSKTFLTNETAIATISTAEYAGEQPSTTRRGNNQPGLTRSKSLPDILKRVVYKDLRFIGISDKQVLWSNLLDVSFDVLSFANPQTRSSELMDLAISRGYVWLGLAYTTEVWATTPDGNLPIAPVQGVAINIGCERCTMRSINDTLYMISPGQENLRSVVKLDGFSPTRSSNFWVEGVLNSAPLANEPLHYYSNGHSFYCLFVGSRCLCYDTIVGQWHERISLNNGGGTIAWNTSCLLNVKGDDGNHRVLHVSTTNPAINIMSDNIYTEYYETWRFGTINGPNTTNIYRERVTPHLSNERSIISVNKLLVDYEKVASDSACNIYLSYSKDRGYTFSTPTARDMRENRAIWWRLGAARDFVFKVSITSNWKVRLLGAEIGIVQGGN